jgi:Uri superfamily endonuclease
LKGAYVLIIRIDSDVSLHIKSLGHLKIDAGILTYVGSAMGSGSTNMENRIRRHFRSEKTIHWHIDHLLATESSLTMAVWSESKEPAECRIVERISESSLFEPSVKGFGASDCKNKCYSHLYRYKGEGSVKEHLNKIFRELGLSPHVTTNGELETS